MASAKHYVPIVVGLYALVVTAFALATTSKQQYTSYIDKIRDLKRGAP